jgi:hypothetical protein
MKTVGLCSLTLVVCAALVLTSVVRNATGASNSLVSLVEARLQVIPGQTRVLPDCGCTVRYIGTFVHGQRYSVVFDKLD